MNPDLVTGGGIIGAVAVAAIAAWKFYWSVRKDTREDRAEDHIAKGYLLLLEELRKEVTRLSPEVYRLSELTTAQTQHILTLEVEAKLSREERAQLIELLTKVKTIQEDMLNAGTLEEPIADIPTRILRPKDTKS